MPQGPSELTLSITPKSRFDIIDVADRVRTQAEDFFLEHRKSAFCSFHTTAGYFEQSLMDRLHNDPEAIQRFIHSFQKIFPEDADYRHDRMELRDELSARQKLVEPRNADSHLTYIGSGLENCVTYDNRPDDPVYFVDLDGTNGATARTRRTTIIGFNNDSVVDQRPIRIGMSHHPIDSVNLWDERIGILGRLQEEVDRLGIDHGRVDLALRSDERNTGLTVNEFETLLMKHDLAEVLRDPLRFMAEKYRNMMADPGAIKEKAKDYMKYDLVHVVNGFIDALGLSESLIERIIDKFFQVPAHHFLRMKRSVSLVVADGGQIVTGTYQSPILVQWRRSSEGARTIEATFTRFE